MRMSGHPFGHPHPQNKKKEKKKKLSYATVNGILFGVVQPESAVKTTDPRHNHIV